MTVRTLCDCDQVGNFVLGERCASERLRLVETVVTTVIRPLASKCILKFRTPIGVSCTALV